MTPEQLTRVLETAVRAPSVHNTQPWLFELRDGALHVRIDPARRLPLEDPLGRELRLSCGAAVDHARLSVRGLGLDCTVDWTVPDDDPDRVAVLTIAGACPTDADELRLLDAVLHRSTDRTAFSPEPVADDLVSELQDAAALEGAHLTAERDHDRVLALEGVVARADSALRNDPDAQRELGRWVRTSARPADGMPAGALPEHGHDRGSALALRDFAPDPDAGPDLGGAPVAEHPLLLVLSTDGDSPQDWARAGAALSRVLLTATAAGLAVNPQTQVLEVSGARWRLVQELGLVGSPQMLLRVGYPTGPGSPATGRRPVSEVLVAAGDAPTRDHG
jgi:nitroreductase